MRIKEGTALDFDDVLLVPQRSSLDSRSEVVLERTFKFRHSPRVMEDVIPIIAANMDTCGSIAVAKALAKHKMLTALHKFYTEDQLVDFFVENQNIWKNVFYTIGTSTKDLEKLMNVCLKVASKIWNINGKDEDERLEIRKRFPEMICLDVANAYCESFVAHLKIIRKLFPDTIILAGNVVTGNMTEELILSGADIVKIGLGSGSCCLTRIKAGVGVPQVAAINECSYQAHGLSSRICSDGGVKNVADICKAIAIGGDFVMIGGFFGGVDECDGEWIYDEEGNKKAIKFHGMSSKEAQEKWNGGMGNYRASEGKEVVIPYKGPIDNVVQEILGGLRSACTYSGASRLKDLPKCAEFVKVNRTHNKVFGE